MKWKQVYSVWEVVVEVVDEMKMLRGQATVSIKGIGPAVAPLVSTLFKSYSA